MFAENGETFAASQEIARSVARDAPPTEEELAALARFRLALRKFLAFSESASAEVGLTMQWYQALLVIRTFHGGGNISVGELAEQLMIRDHSAAELVSRLAQAKLVKRKTDPGDRRRSLILMTASGNRCLDRLASVHLRQLQDSKGAFLNLFNAGQEGAAAEGTPDEPAGAGARPPPK